MLGLILGVFVVVLGAKAFTPTGIPLTREKNLTGVAAKVIGVICLLFGGTLILSGLFSFLNIVSLFDGAGR